MYKQSFILDCSSWNSPKSKVWWTSPTSYSTSKTVWPPTDSKY